MNGLVLWLYEIPTFWLGVLFISVFLAYSLGGLWLTRPWMRSGVSSTAIGIELKASWPLTRFSSTLRSKRARKLKLSTGRATIRFGRRPSVRSTAR